MSPYIYTPVVNDKCVIHIYRTVILVALRGLSDTNTHSYSEKDILCRWYKGLHTNCRLASCFMSYAPEHMNAYHGIA